MQQQETKEIKCASEDIKTYNENLFPRSTIAATTAKAIDPIADRAQTISYIDFPV